MALDPKYTFFCADPHLGHRNMTKAGKNYCGRPFIDEADMQNQLVHNWNEVVPPGGTVYLIGDFSDKLSYVEDFCKRVNGSIHLIFGNHDEHINGAAFRGAGVVRCDIRRRITVQDPDGNVQQGDSKRSDGQKLKNPYQEIILDHYPLQTWQKKPYRSWHLHGHVHGNYQHLEGQYGYRLDMGIDIPEWNYAPVSYERVKAKMASLPIKAETYKTEFRV
jgi:calcineurin-like phosphoesterase family protein